MYYGIALYLREIFNIIPLDLFLMEVLSLVSCQSLQIKCLPPSTVRKNGRHDGNLSKKNRKPCAYISYLVKCKHK